MATILGDAQSDQYHIRFRFAGRAFKRSWGAPSLQARGDDGNRCNALFHSNGNFVCRAFTSDDYARIWNYELIGRLRDVMGDGWRVPPARPAFINQPGARPATEADVLARKTTGGGLTINMGDMIAPAGLYASDHDCFIFMVNEEQRIDDGSDGGLSRGFFISHSEVGASALKVTNARSWNRF